MHLMWSLRRGDTPRDLELFSIFSFVGRSPVASSDVDLPLCQTLKKLTIEAGSVQWLDGHRFLQLRSFDAWPGPDWRNSFPQRVEMPV